MWSGARPDKHDRRLKWVATAIKHCEVAPVPRICKVQGTLISALRIVRFLRGRLVQASR